MCDVIRMLGYSCAHLCTRLPNSYFTCTCIVYLLHVIVGKYLYVQWKTTRMVCG